jgi:hypothetical protein
MIAPAPAPTAPPITAPSAVLFGELAHPALEATRARHTNNKNAFSIFYPPLLIF